MLPLSKGLVFMYSPNSYSLSIFHRDYLNESVAMVGSDSKMYIDDFIKDKQEFSRFIMTLATIMRFNYELLEDDSENIRYVVKELL